MAQMFCLRNRVKLERDQQYQSEGQQCPARAEPEGVEALAGSIKGGNMDTIEYKGYNIEILPDENPDDPRTWDNLGTMLCFHRRYTLGDKTDLSSDNFNGWNEIYNYLVKEKHAVVILPLYLYDHGGICMKVGSFSGLLPQGHAEFDSGQVGFIYVTKEKIQEAFIPKAKIMTKAIKEKAEKVLRAEVEIYNQYISGDVYGFRITKNDQEFDACWGFFGSDDAEAEAKSQVDYFSEEEKKLTPALLA
jgi:hypothetical protein